MRLPGETVTDKADPSCKVATMKSMMNHLDFVNNSCLFEILDPASRKDLGAFVRAVLHENVLVSLNENVTLTVLKC